MTVNLQTGKPFPRGLTPTSRHKLCAAPSFRPVFAPPAQVIRVPQHLDMWGNDQYGDCVTACEAFRKACYDPEIFIPAQTVISWASKHGVLNGADLPQVMDMMQNDGFVIGSQKYDDGPYATVDYSNEAAMQAALALGPLNIGIDANALPNGAGNVQGWYAFGGGTNRSEDHCVAISSFGTASQLFTALGVPVPSGAPSGILYMIYTWSTQGVVDHKWIMNTLGEAWICNPTTVGVPPLPGPPPPPPPPPPVQNILHVVTAIPAETIQVGTGTLIGPIAVGDYPIGPAPTPPPPPPSGAVFTPEDRAALVKILAENPA